MNLTSLGSCGGFSLALAALGSTTSVWVLILLVAARWTPLHAWGQWEVPEEGWIIYSQAGHPWPGGQVSLEEGPLLFREVLLLHDGGDGLHPLWLAEVGVALVPGLLADSRQGVSELDGGPDCSVDLSHQAEVETYVDVHRSPVGAAPHVDAPFSVGCRVPRVTLEVPAEKGVLYIDNHPSSGALWYRGRWGIILGGENCVHREVRPPDIQYIVVHHQSWPVVHVFLPIYES